MRESEPNKTKEELNFQWSSTSLGNKEEGGLEASATLLQGLLSKESYTKTVFEKADKFKEETERYFPNEASFGVSILPTMINKESLFQFKGLVEKGSIDIPYLINWLKLPSQKAKEIIARRGVSLRGTLQYGLEIAYAMMQANGKQDLKNSLEGVLESFPVNSPVTMRTCIENASNRKVQIVMKDLVESNPNIQYALEPNAKLVNTLPEYISFIEKLRKDNPDLKIGLDLDLTHLSDENRGLISILQRLEDTKDFPMFISLSGKVLSNQENLDFGIHAPLNLQDPQIITNLGEYYSHLRFRNRKLPSFVFEQSPVEKGLIDNYKKFLKSFRKGYHPN
jgi:hypothetical protein